MSYGLLPISTVHDAILRHAEMFNIPLVEDEEIKASVYIAMVTKGPAANGTLHTSNGTYPEGYYIKIDEEEFLWSVRKIKEEKQGPRVVKKRTHELG